METPCVTTSHGCCIHYLSWDSTVLVIIVVITGAWWSAAASSSTSSSAAAWIPAAEAASVSSVLAALYVIAAWACHIGGLIALLSLHYVKFHLLSISHTTQVFAGIILDDGRLKIKAIYFLYKDIHIAKI